MKKHLFIIITIVIGFSSFLLGYSLPPFLEVGFGDNDAAVIDGGPGNDDDLLKQYQDLYKDTEE
ncbi:MAG TPA: hypothetical protein ENI88_01655 [Desulfobulbus sp.]|nr:hypothetical protein [Desulfobulbus sp.]